ncbi:unnamed protein product [Chrysodeixis includens]|uniref:VWFC domain-containing protein n=1 Tax=Chrysodeixis includens TaxID=689277 RepID=A0A9N8L648_CHRIL|nr:unnamed protein product [Chrysodeixis includens]
MQRLSRLVDGQPECEDGQPWIHLDECNSCFCEEGKLECSDYICIRGSKCKKGDRIPKPDRCNACECVNGHVGCTNIECRPLRKPLSSDNATTEPFGETTTNRGTTLDYAATTVKGVVLDDNMLIAKRIEIVLKPTVGVETTTEQGALSNDWVILEKRVKVDEFPDKETVTDKGFTTDKGLTTDEGFTTDAGVTTDKVTAINEGDAINGDKDAIMIPEVDKRFGIDEEATKIGESFKQCENGVDIPPPPPPLDCNVCICLNNQILCTVDACKDGVPGKGRYDGRGSGKRPHYRPDSREDSDPRNKKKTYHSEPNFQHDVKFDERGPLDPFQYKEPSEKEYTVKKVKLNKHKPPKTIPDEDQYLSVIPHKSDYPSYSLYPKQNNDPRSQPKYNENLPTSVSQDSITNPGSHEESQNPKTYQNYVNEPPLKPETDTFDDRGAHEGFQYISNSDENSSDPVNSKNKPDHNQLDPSNRGKKSKPTSDTVDMQSIDPAVLKILENAHKPLSIEDLLNELDGHKHPHNDPTNYNNDNDDLQSRFNDDGPDVPSYPAEQMNKKAPTSPPIDDSGFSLSDLDPFVLLRLLFPSGFDQKKTDKKDDQQKDIEKDLLAVLLGSQNIYTNTTKYNKPLNKENYNYTIVKYNITPLSSSKNPRDEKNMPGQNPTVNHLDSRNDMSKANALASQPKLNGVENDQKPKVLADNLNQHHPGNNMDPKIEVQNHHNVYTVPFQAGTIPPSTSGQGQDQPQYQQYAIISDEGKKLPPIQYPEVHIILHQRKDDDNDDVISYFPSLLNSRMKNLKEPKSECGENSHWTRNCHACVCRGGQASCVKVPDCVQRALDEPMMCKPYSTFKMGTCYSCECNGDGIPECDAAGCKIEPKIHENEEGKPGKCKPNSKFYPKSTNVACQQCSCDDEANPFCPLEESQNVSI